MFREESTTRGSRIPGALCPSASASDPGRRHPSEPPTRVRRRRECEACGERFTTYERAEEPRVTVVKRDGSRERFDRQKLLRGLARAAGGRPVSARAARGGRRVDRREVRRGGGRGRRPSAIGDLAERGLARVGPGERDPVRLRLPQPRRPRRARGGRQALQGRPPAGRRSARHRRRSVPSDPQSSIGLSREGSRQSPTRGEVMSDSRSAAAPSDHRSRCRGQCSAALHGGGHAPLRLRRVGDPRRR